MAGIDDIMRVLGGGGGAVAIPLGGSGAGRQVVKEACSLPLDVQEMRLQEYLSRFQKPCPYQPGDLVTPAPDSQYVAKGALFMVLEVFDTPVRLVNGEPSTMEFCSLHTLRVCRLIPSQSGETIVAFAAHHADYLPFARAAEQPANQPGGSDAGAA